MGSPSSIRPPVLRACPASKLSRTSPRPRLIWLPPFLRLLACDTLWQQHSTVKIAYAGTHFSPDDLPRAPCPVPRPRATPCASATLDSRPGAPEPVRHTEDDMAEPLILLAYDDRGAQGRVATVTLNNPAKLNTMNCALMAAFLDVMATLRVDETLRAVILRGAGDRAFVGGADLRELAALNPATAEEFITFVHRCCHAVRALPVPVIARIRGHALGAGLELAASCDIRIASTDSHFGMPEVRVGLPSVVEAALLPGLIGWGRTRQLLLTGDAIDGEKAERWGLVEELVAPEDLDATVARIIDAIVASGPRAIKLQKQLITDWEDLPLRAAIHKGIICIAGAFTTDEPTRMLAETLARLAARKLT